MARQYFDRFGNPAQNVVCTDKKGNGFYRGYLEIGHKLYKIEPGEVKEGRKGDSVVYVRVTQVKRSNQRNAFGGVGNRAYGPSIM